MNITSQRLGVYSGYVFMVLLLLGFAVVAGFFPPPSPHESAAQIQHLFQHRTLRIRFGMLISLVSSGFLLPWCATLITQVRRIEGTRHTPITWLQTVGFGAFVILFVYPEMVWALAAFRPNVSAELVRGFNDFAWLGFVCIVSTAMIQMFALGWVVLRDKRPDPIYPRWFGWFNLWVWTLFIPADLIFFFKTGPFAWNGLFGFGLSFGAYFGWMLTVTIMTGRAVNRQAAAREEDEPDLTEIAAKYEQLRRDMDRLIAEHPEVPSHV